MSPIEKRLIVDESHNPVAVVLDYKTFETIERILEDYALGKLMQQVEDEPSYSLAEARAHYDALPKER